MRRFLLAFVVPALLVAGCSAPASHAAASVADSGDHPGVTLAANDGPTLIVLSLDPARTGDNTLSVDLRSANGDVVPGAVQVAISIDGVPAPSLTLPSGDRRRPVTIARSGQAEITVKAIDGVAASAHATFALALPIVPLPVSTLTDIDAAMRGLHTIREEQTLTSGGPVLLFHFEYAAPDRVRYTMVKPGAATTETRLIGAERFDRDGAGPWTSSNMGFGSRVPASELARAATRIALIGRDHDGAEPLIEIAFIQPGGIHYRVWAGANDHLVRRYTMMANGHYMTGTYTDFDVPLAIAAP